MRDPVEDRTSQLNHTTPISWFALVCPMQPCHSINPTLETIHRSALGGPVTHSACLVRRGGCRVSTWRRGAVTHFGAGLAQRFGKLPDQTTSIRTGHPTALAAVSGQSDKVPVDQHAPAPVVRVAARQGRVD